jgi:hypothetical protein
VAAAEPATMGRDFSFRARAMAGSADEHPGASSLTDAV